MKASDHDKHKMHKFSSADLSGVIELFNSISPHVTRQENVEKRLQVVKSLKAKANAKRTPTEKFADWLTSKFGTITFLLLNFAWFGVWAVINTGKVPGVEPFDPFPFGLLTTLVSLEAIFLAIIVLISQNREARIAELREEIELQISTISEGEITKLIHLVSLLLEKEGIKSDNDSELKDMLKPTNPDVLQKEVEEELQN